MKSINYTYISIAALVFLTAVFWLSCLHSLDQTTQAQSIPNLLPKIRTYAPADEIVVIISDGTKYAVTPSNNFTTAVISEIRRTGVFVESGGETTWLCPYQIVSVEIITTKSKHLIK